MEERLREKAQKLKNKVKESGITNPILYNILDVLTLLPNKDLLLAIEQGISSQVAYNQLYTSPLPKQNQEVDGGLIFSITETGYPVGLNLNEVHTLIAGSSNSGKTVCQEILVLEAVRQGHTVWMFVKADDVTRIIRSCKEILYTDFTNSLWLNPLFFLNKEDFTTIFRDSFILYEGSEGYLLDVIGELKSKNNNANIYDLYYFIRSKKHPLLSREARFRESILNRTKGFLSSPLGRTFDCIKGHESDILKSNIIFNISRLTLPEQKFIINSLITFLYRSNTEETKCMS